MKRRRRADKTEEEHDPDFQKTKRSKLSTTKTVPKRETTVRQASQLQVLLEREILETNPLEQDARHITNQLEEWMQGQPSANDSIACARMARQICTSIGCGAAEFVRRHGIQHFDPHQLWKESSICQAMLQEHNNALSACHANAALKIQSNVETHFLTNKRGEGTAKCRNCGSTEFKVVLVQTSGGDEPMTAFCTCENPKCNHKWTMR